MLRDDFQFDQRGTYPSENGAMPRITMKEIAERARVSLATVSRAMHSPQLVQPETRKRIFRVMEEHHYVYNAVAADLSRQKTSIIGLIIPTVTNSIFAKSIAGVQEYAQSQGFSVLIGNTDYEESTEAMLFDHLLRRRIAGMILTGLAPHMVDRFRSLARNDIPSVIIWETSDDPSVNFVGFDNFKAANSITEHLINLGHTRIGLIAGPFSKVRRVQQRLEGYRAALESNGISFDPARVIETPFYSLLNGEEAMARLLNSHPDCSAVFAASDVLAMGALKTLRSRGVRVPADMSLAGFDDIDFAAYCDPPLTTVRVPGYEMGALAARILFEDIAGGGGQVRRFNLDTDLILRDSCGRFGGKTAAVRPVG